MKYKTILNCNFEVNRNYYTKGQEIELDINKLNDKYLVQINEDCNIEFDNMESVLSLLESLEITPTVSIDNGGTKSDSEVVLEVKKIDRELLINTLNELTKLLKDSNINISSEIADNELSYKFTKGDYTFELFQSNDGLIDCKFLVNS